MKKIFVCTIVVVLACFFVSGCGNKSAETENIAVSPTADWNTHYFSLDELVKETDLIAVCKVSGSMTEIRHGIVFTMQEVEINELIKSSDNMLSKIKLLQTGGKKDGYETMPFAEAPLLEKGKSYFLFLEDTPEGHFLIAGGYQGAAEICEEETISFLNDFEKITDEIDGKNKDDVKKYLASFL